jgi:Cdc6-like AAA superfamily ATPase
VYEPYSNTQVKTIIESRLKDIDIFDPMGITLISKKIATYTGDIRRAL